MRERFQLCSKVIGLLLFLTGVIIVANSGLQYLVSDSWISLGQLLTKQEGPKVFDSVLRQVMYRTMIHGPVPILFGLYLMYSENLFVKLCYGARRPKETKPSQPKEVDLPPPPPRPDRDYAPPGYHE